MIKCNEVIRISFPTKMINISFKTSKQSQGNNFLDKNHRKMSRALQWELKKLLCGSSFTGPEKQESKVGPKFLHAAFSQKPHRKGSKTLKKKITLKDKRWGFSNGFHHNLFFFFKKEKLYLGMEWNKLKFCSLLHWSFF